MQVTTNELLETIGSLTVEKSLLLRRIKQLEEANQELTRALSGPRRATSEVKEG